MYITVLLTDTDSLERVRSTDFRLIHPDIDPTTHLQRPFNLHYRQPSPSTITIATPSPAHTAQARAYLDAVERAVLHNDELDRLDQQEAIQWLPKNDTTPDCRRISLTMTYKYTSAINVTLCRFKARCSIRGDSMRPVVHYNLDTTAAYAVDKTTISSLYAPAAARLHPLMHLDIKSSFNSEN